MAEYIPGVEAGANKSGIIVCGLKDVSTIPNFEDESFNQKNIDRREILNFGNEGFLLHGNLTTSECLHIINEGEKIGFDKIYGSRDNYRSALRITLSSPFLADVLWKRIQSHVEDISIDGDQSAQHIQGTPAILQGQWRPTGLNHIFRLCKYLPGGHFAPHFDGFYQKDSSNRSLKTFMIYLNGDFSDGTTNFVDENQTLHMDEQGKYCAEEKNILCRLKPEPGMAILFNHHRLHEGQQVRDGVKYILRTDIMYTKIDAPKCSPQDEEALQLVQEAERLEASGECMKAAEFYRKAFKMSTSLAEAYGN